MFVIMKSTRLYKGGPGYAGGSCAIAGVPYGKVYTDRAEAEKDCDKLCRVNLAGFTVRPFNPER